MKPIDRVRVRLRIKIQPTTSKIAQRPFKLALSAGNFLTQPGSARRLACATRASSDARSLDSKKPTTWPSSTRARRSLCVIASEPAARSAAEASCNPSLNRPWTKVLICSLRPVRNHQRSGQGAEPLRVMREHRRRVVIGID